MHRKGNKNQVLLKHCQTIVKRNGTTACRFWVLWYDQAQKGIIGGRTPELAGSGCYSNGMEKEQPQSIMGH